MAESSLQVLQVYKSLFPIAIAQLINYGKLSSTQILLSPSVGIQES